MLALSRNFKQQQEGLIVLHPRYKDGVNSAMNHSTKEKGYHLQDFVSFSAYENSMNISYQLSGLVRQNYYPIGLTGSIYHTSWNEVSADKALRRQTRSWKTYMLVYKISANQRRVQKPGNKCSHSRPERSLINSHV